MKLNDDARIDVISSISDEHIEAVAVERIEAKARVRRKQVLFRSVATVAASFLLIIPSIILILSGMMNRGQVPVYKGMTVSNTFPEQIAYSSAYSSTADALSYTQDLDYVSRLILMNEEKNGRPIDDGLKDYFSATSGGIMYYARPNEDIYITVKIENPDNYEILSFTLNGNKYTSYMFEDGSDMTNIVLKVNVGDVSGLVSYTIDAMKYVDGDQIKDVRMEGERTVNIGVYSENQPTAAISGMTVTSASVSFSASSLDPESLIAATNGTLYAIIYDGENVVAEKEITAGTDTEVLFEGLEPNTEYVAAVVAVFDAYDGLGTFPHLLYSEQFIAMSRIVARDITVVGNDVSFELYYANEEIVLTGLELTDWLGNVVYSTDSAVTEIKDIPAGKLTLRFSYKYTEDGVEKTGESETVFWCAEGMLPVKGEISFHYSDSVISHPIHGGYIMHQATELTPTTDDLSVYSISDGVVTSVTQYFWAPPPEGALAPGTLIDGVIEILDGNGVYHYYKFLRDIPFEVGDEVKVGDVLGELYSCGDMLPSGYNLHYACYTLSGNTKIYQCPAFDAPVKSESERISDMFEANPILLEGLTVSGKYGETVTVRVTFNTVVGDEIVALYYGFSSDSRVELVRIEDNVWDLVCNFEGLTEEEDVLIEFVIFFDYYNTGSSFAVMLSPTDVPKEPNGTEIPDDDGDGTFTIPEAVAAADGTPVVVRGIVSSVTEWNTTYNNNNVTIIDADGNSLFVYRLATKVCLGDEIIVTGTIKTYNGMKEIAEGCTAEIVTAHGDNHTYVDGSCSVCGEIDPSKDH